MVQVILELTREQAEALHDLVVDADMHDGAVTLPRPLPAGTHDAVAEPILDALRPAWLRRGVASDRTPAQRTGGYAS
jgi:hypothetical protein